MKYNQLVGDCCRYLAAKNPTSTDADLTQFIGLQRLAEEVASTFGFDATIYETVPRSGRRRAISESV